MGRSLGLRVSVSFYLPEELLFCVGDDRWRELLSIGEGDAAEFSEEGNGRTPN
jgi:hypothetical protein